jgi:RNA polymerase-binding transcription factor DksA
MTISELTPAVLALHEQSTLREAPRDRRHRRSRAVHRYEVALTVESDGSALASLGVAGNGMCDRCRRPIPLHALTLRPFERLCRYCEPLDAA